MLLVIAVGDGLLSITEGFAGFGRRVKIFPIYNFPDIIRTGCSGSIRSDISLIISVSYVY